MSVFLRAVSAYMSTPVESIAGDATVEAATARLLARRVSSFVVDGPDGTVVGVISRTDLLRRQGPLVRDRMTQPVLTADPDATLAEAARTMWSHRIHRVYVLKDGRATGVLSTREVMLAVRDSKDTTPIGDLMTTPVVTIEVDRPASEATALLAELPLGGVVVVEHEHPVGLYAQGEALAAAALVPGALVDDAMSPALLCLRGAIPAHRAAAFSVSTRARRIVVVHHHVIAGIVSGMDFVRLAAGVPEPDRGLAARTVGAARAS